jgi:hypothetical protein
MNLDFESNLQKHSNWRRFKEKNNVTFAYDNVTFAYGLRSIEHPYKTRSLTPRVIPLRLR